MTETIDIFIDYLKRMNKEGYFEKIDQADKKAWLTAINNFSIPAYFGNADLLQFKYMINQQLKKLEQ